MAIDYRRLIALHEQRPAEADGLLREAIAARELNPADIDLGRLFCECFGWHEFVECRARKQLANDVFARALTEAEGAVSTSAFLNVTGQIVYSFVLQGSQSEDFVFSKLIPEQMTAFLDGEKVAGLTEIGDEAAIRNENDPYVLAGFGEDWIFTPPVKDRGMIVPLSWEAVFADRTGQIQDRARDVGKWWGVNDEKRAIDCVVDENVTAHRYNWRGTVIASYGDNSGTHSWDNLSATNALVDWTDVDNAEQVYNALVDPYTGEPGSWGNVLSDLIVTKQLEKTAMRIATATQLRVATPGYATSGNPTQSVVNNMYSGTFRVLSSKLLAARMATDTDWFLGDVKAYAKKMVAEKMDVLQAPANNKDEFERRIVSQWRVNGRDAYVVVQPRAIVKNTVS